MDQMIELARPLGKVGNILPTTKQFNTIPLFVRSLGLVTFCPSVDRFSHFLFTGVQAKRVALHFELMFTRPENDAEPEKQGAILQRVSQLVDAKVLRSTANLRFSWDKLVDALLLQDSGRAVGKIVLSVQF